MEYRKARNFFDLIMWKKAHQFVLAIYKVTEKFHKSELYGLVSQMGRAAVSIPANIAEGFRKKSRAEKLHFLNISHSSLEECRYYLILAKDLNFYNTDILMNDIEEISKILKGYSDKIEFSK